MDKEIEKQIKQDISIYIQQKLNTIVPLQEQPTQMQAQPPAQQQPGQIALPGQQ